MKLNITKGEWRRFNNRIEVWSDMGAYQSQDKVFEITTGQQSYDNTLLVCDAGNTYQKCGLLPSEILKENKEILSISEDCRDLTKELIEDRKELISVLEKFTILNENAPEFRSIAGLILNAREIVKKAKEI